MQRTENGLRLASLKDFADGLLILSLLPIAWFLPARCWVPIARSLGKMHFRFLGRARAPIDTVLRNELGIGQAEMETGYRTEIFLELLEILREHAPWGWHPPITVVGRHHLDAALARGRGAVLWYTPFTHADIVFKKGLHQAGFRVNHLSALTHGISDTRLGLALLNPLKTRIECRYLKERCIMHPGRVGTVIRSLLDRLRRNEVVSVTALASGRRTGARPFLGGTIRLAKGAPNFALTTGAALIPVFVVPKDDGYEVRIERPLGARNSDIAAAEEECISAYVPILERYVRAWPHLWRGWLGSPVYWSPDAAPAQITGRICDAA